MMKQKIVIKLPMPSEKCRSKAMAVVAATGGVESVAIAGDTKDQVVVVGEGVDSVRLTSALRRKVGRGRAELLEVSDATKKKKPADECPTVWFPPYPPLGVLYDYDQGPGNACSIL